MRDTTKEPGLVLVRKTSEGKGLIAIPPIILKKIYCIGSLRNLDDGVSFAIKNPLKDAMITSLEGISLDGSGLALEEVVVTGGGTSLSASEVSDDRPLPFPMGEDVTFLVRGVSLPKHTGHRISISCHTDLFGPLELEGEDHVTETREARKKLPYDKLDNYSMDIVRKRQDFVEEYTGKPFHHVRQHSFDPAVTKGNIENFTGVAQIPLGFAGPLLIDGEHARGEFLIPMCTSEGTLVASYSRGMKILNMCGGVKVTVVEDRMQRSPAFAFDSAREGRDFIHWIDEHMEEIRGYAESASKVARLLNIERYMASRLVYLRFNYSTGDAAGQNMVSMCTYTACNWILSQVSTVRHFYMDGNISTDKKASLINNLVTRGKRVIGEIRIPREVLIEHMRVDPVTLDYLCRACQLGAFMGGAVSNGLHAANALAAIFMATGQDVANVAESSTGYVCTEVTPEGDLYGSLTLPSLIVATYGGGTGLPTQRECLEMLGCYGQGNVLKFAEIVTAAATAGEISLAGAIASLDWVTSHERMGKNR
ncbi:MAG TPA: hydroxymethylglutaryl-CoA reductase [Deltaproteobacteria bacterium]|jgi:hydroxymethylglutaryl-CoA reductase (NADPH)|nr:hydroxymethylglutaryl-CoA reductase [Deltaproteobacteria bacterium]HOI06144.1 hydroxymethylglutaryl-CoA reductase [Deltaproteobacteria bacterium]